jgi:ABC-type antimicrobial peptide transport system permease subunit
VLAAAQARPRFLTLLLGLFSSVALGLAALGMYSVMSYAVAQRTSEFGIRMAMGAQRADVLRLVLGRGLALSALGLLLGGVGAGLLNQWLAGALYGIGGFDAAPFAAMGALLVAVTVLACLAPALRATKVDPIVALRYE